MALNADDFFSRKYISNVNVNLKYLQKCIWLSVSIRELRFCLRDNSKVSNISLRAAFVGVLCRFRRNVTVPRSSAIRASIPAVKQTILNNDYYYFCADKDRYFTEIATITEFNSLNTIAIKLQPMFN